MRVVVQRVSQAQVEVSGQVVNQINKGFLILLGIFQGDTEKEVDYLVKKVSQLRVMADKQQKMNLALKEVDGEILVVSQFTLCANTEKGNRPSFIKAAQPKKAKKLYQLFIQGLKKTGLSVKTGQFGNYMQVKLVNDGPVTIIIDR